MSEFSGGLDPYMLRTREELTYISTRYTVSSKMTLYPNRKKLARSRTNTEASVVATQGTGRVHVP